MTAWRAMSVETAVRKVTFKNAWTSLKVIKIVATWLAIYYFLLVVCGNNDSILHRFGDVTTFTGLWITLTLHSPSVLIRLVRFLIHV